MNVLRPTRSPSRLAGLLLVASFPALASPPGAAAQGSDGCVRCHGELELLRQHVATLEDARDLEVDAGALAASAHAGTACVACHTGFGTFPHGDGGATESCASCHGEETVSWEAGAHAPDDHARCADCHGVHDVRSAEALRTADGLAAVREACAACHFEPALPSDDPHADSASCAGCHAPHGTRSPDDPDSRVHPARQPETCGACHQDVIEVWREDRHAAALPGLARPGAEVPEGATSADPPTCSACHGAHGMLAPSHDRFDQQMVERCAACHADDADTYFGTYHGKATALGSEIVATCDHCHGSHAVFPASDPRSRVAPDSLVATCGACHEAARPAFVAYDAHPDPMDRSRNAPLFYSFVFMNALLIGVLGLFALHTFLWWLRLLVDRQKGVVHGIGGGHG